jgi:anti-anti-sigma factor
VVQYTQKPGLQINLRQCGATAVLEIFGRLIVEAPDHSLVDLTELMPRGGRCLLLLDLRGVSQMDCSGIGQLVKLFVKIRRLGGCFALVNVQRRPRRLLDMSGLLELFTAFASALSVPARMQNYDVTHR